jgi:aspartokinase/homoserine dehydrogenase 1
VTAEETAATLEYAVSHGAHVVLANKRPVSGNRAQAEALRVAAAAHGRRILYEATVGAGLPILDTFAKLVEAGDTVHSIEGCPSGTMGYLFGELGRDTPFSTALRNAMKLGYTEPDPRDDLSGIDVARKALILGRLLGFPGEFSDVQVESLVPPDAKDLPLPEFLNQLERYDDVWASRVIQARSRGAVLRYRATATPDAVTVGLVEVPATGVLGALNGTDNQFTFTTARYNTNPLVITGPGAGPAVTAAGVLNDVLKAAGAL